MPHGGESSIFLFLYKLSSQKDISCIPMLYLKVSHDILQGHRQFHCEFLNFRNALTL